jgi:hypothetical protein
MAKSLFEQPGGTYRKESDFLIPCLTVPAEEKKFNRHMGVSECRWHSSCEPTEPAGEKAASGLSEAVSQGYIHQASHKRQAGHLSCRHFLLL